MERNMAGGKPDRVMTYGYNPVSCLRNTDFALLM